MKKFVKVVSLACASAMLLSTTAFADGDAFKVGGIGPVTGGAAVYGQAVKNATELAVNEINALGGVQFEFQFEDDEHDAEKSVNAYNSLKDWGMQMLLGTVTSAPCIAVAAETANDNMFQLTPSGSAVECVQNPNAFRVCFSDPNQGTASAQYIGENKIATKIGVIYDSSDVYSSGIYEKFAAEAANQGLEIVSAEAFTADSKTDFTVQLQNCLLYTSSLSQTIYSSDGSPVLLGDRLPDEQDQTEALLNRMLLRQLLGLLDSEEQHIIHLRYFEECTQMQVAAALGMTQVQVSRAEKRILRKLREAGRT